MGGIDQQVVFFGNDDGRNEQGERVSRFNPAIAKLPGRNRVRKVVPVLGNPPRFQNGAVGYIHGNEDWVCWERIPCDMDEKLEQGECSRRRCVGYADADGVPAAPNPSGAFPGKRTRGMWDTRQSPYAH